MVATSTKTDPNKTLKDSEITHWVCDCDLELTLCGIQESVDNHTDKDPDCIVCINSSCRHCGWSPSNMEGS